MTRHDDNAKMLVLQKENRHFGIVIMYNLKLGDLMAVPNCWFYYMKSNVFAISSPGPKTVSDLSPGPRNSDRFGPRVDILALSSCIASRWLRHMCCFPIGKPMILQNYHL